MSNMIFLINLALGWQLLVERLSLEERKPYVADGTVDGQRYSVMQRDGQLYFILPDHPRETCRKIVEKLLKRLQPDAEVSSITQYGFASGFCNFCLSEADLPFKCRRCAGWYCHPHRLPEDHNCPGSQVFYDQKPAARHGKMERSKKVQVVEVPCG